MSNDVDPRSQTMNNVQNEKIKMEFKSVCVAWWKKMMIEFKQNKMIGMKLRDVRGCFLHEQNFHYHLFSMMKFRFLVLEKMDSL